MAHLRHLTSVFFLAACLTNPAFAHPGPHGSAPHDVDAGEQQDGGDAHDHEDAPVTYGNGVGPDPDGDTNPATNTRAVSKIGDAAEAAFDPPYQVVTFEAPPGGHNDVIRKEYEDKFGVTFSRGLNRQICEGQRYFQYNSQCTYLRAPSGQYAAVYQDDFSRPLRIRFAEPVCVAAMAIYPTGGKEGEVFEVTLQGYDANEQKLDAAKAKFTWTKDTFRWRHMAGAYFLGQKAQRVDVSMRSLDPKEKGKVVRFLLDDVAFIEESCTGNEAPLATEVPIGS